MIIRENSALHARATARVVALQEFATRRHLHLKSTGGDASPAEAVIPADDFDALLAGLTRLDRVQLSERFVLVRGAPGSIWIEVDGPPVPAGTKCDDCGVVDPPSLIAWPAEERWHTKLELGRMNTPERSVLVPLLCVFCDADRQRFGHGKTATASAPAP